MLFLHQLDARHVGAIAFAVPGLENARVAARPLGVPGTDLTEQLVRGFALVNVSAGQAPRVQRAGLRFADQLLDERTKLLGLRLGRLDGSVLDQRRRQVPQQCEPLLAGAAKLTPRVTVPSHWLTPPPYRQAQPRRPGSAACPSRAPATRRLPLRTASRS